MGEEAIGYISLLHASEPSQPRLYTLVDRSGYLGWYKNGPYWLTADMEGKIWARCNYAATRILNGFSPEVVAGREPDAYIFRPDAVRGAGLKILHTYRLLKPRARPTSADR